MGHSRTTLAAVLAIVALTLSACSSSSVAAPTMAPMPSYDAGTTMARIAAAGRMRVGIQYHQPGFGLKGMDGTFSGLDIEIATIIAGAMGLTADNIDWVETPSTDPEELIENSRVDLVAAGLTINDKSRERITFAGPYYVAGQQLMVGSDNATIKGPADLKANPYQKICAVTGSTFARQIEPYLSDPTQLIVSSTVDACVDALRANHVQVVTDDNVILLGLTTTSDNAFTLVGQQFTKEPYGIGITKGDVAFCEFINATLRQGAYAKAVADTAGELQRGAPATLPAATICI